MYLVRQTLLVKNLNGCPLFNLEITQGNVSVFLFQYLFYYGHDMALSLYNKEWKIGAVGSELID